VAVIVADGVPDGIDNLTEQLAQEGAVPVILGATLGRVKSVSGKPIEISASLDVAPAVTFDALVLPGGEAAAERMSQNGRVLEFVKDTYRHCKPILVIGDASRVLEAAGVPASLPSGKPDPGLIVSDGAPNSAAEFITAIAKHRHYERESEPVPVV
jgi:catalase